MPINLSGTHKTPPSECRSFPSPTIVIDDWKQIVDFLDEEIDKIQLLISQTKSLVKNLEEFYQSLIFSVVTGKICVTN